MSDRYLTQSEACIDLANAIITKAIMDYKNAYMHHIEHPNDATYRNALSELQVFFRSEWFQNLTPLDAAALLKPIEQECKEKLRIRNELMNKRKEKLRGND